MLKETLRNIPGSNENEFLVKLHSLSLNDPTVLETASIRSLIDFKWKTYAKWFFMPHFLLNIAFLVLFIID